jgi:hypothetical protein
MDARLPSMDVGKFLRLQGAIQATIEGSAGKSSTQAGPAVEDAYFRLRQEAWDAIPEKDREEFDRLFPSTVIPSPKARNQMQPVTPLETYGTAQTLLTSLAGWLGGYIQETRMRAEAEAYAEARVKAERSVGFKGGQSG